MALGVLLSLLLPFAFGAAAGAPALQLQQARFPAGSLPETVQAQSDGFAVADPQALRIAASVDAQDDWLRLQASPAPPAGSVLVIDRAALLEIALWSDASASEPVARRGFFSRSEDEFLPARFAFPWPEGQETLLLQLRAATPQQVGLRLMSAADLARAERGASAAAAASYAAVLATMLASLALTLAVHEGSFRYFTGFAALFGLFLAAGEGHLAELPGMQVLAALHLKPVLLLGMASVAAALALASRLLGWPEQVAERARWLDRAALGLLAVGALALLLPAAQLPLGVLLFGLLMLLAAALPMAMSAWSWSLGSLFAGALCLVWAGFLAVVAARVAVLTGWLVAADGLRLFHQLGGALVVVGLSIALTDRVIELRRRVEQIQLAHAESTATLQMEQFRRRFLQALKEIAGGAVAAGDVEWKAFRLLMQAVAELVPNRMVGLSASGYRGFDYLLAEPMAGKARLCTVLAERSATLKGICRSRTPMQVPFDVGEAGRESQRLQFAIIPLAIPRPGWGALLIEREPGLEFSSAELGIAAEFAELAMHAIEEHALKADLRRGAEFDSLTGLVNRRAGEARLEMLLQEAQSAKQALSLLFVDFDQFKPINDRHGVAVGDQCLRAVADALRPLVGAVDLVVRYGGDEFVIALPGQTEERALALGERVRAEIASLRIKTEKGPIKITVSIGVAGAVLASDTLARLIDRAERASGIAKGKGRNQVQAAAGLVHLAPPPDKPPIF